MGEIEPGKGETMMKLYALQICALNKDGFFLLRIYIQTRGKLLSGAVLVLSFLVSPRWHLSGHQVIKSSLVRL